MGDNIGSMFDEYILANRARAFKMGPYMLDKVQSKSAGAHQLLQHSDALIVLAGHKRVNDSDWVAPLNDACLRFGIAIDSKKAVNALRVMSFHLRRCTGACGTKHLQAALGQLPAGQKSQFRNLLSHLGGEGCPIAPLATTARRRSSRAPSQTWTCSLVNDLCTWGTIVMLYLFINFHYRFSDFLGCSFGFISNLCIQFYSARAPLVPSVSGPPFWLRAA